MCAVMDARCNQVYNAIFRIQNGIVMRLCDDRAIFIEDLKKDLHNYNERIILAGDGADLVYSKINDGLIELAPPALKYQTGTGVCFASEHCSDISADSLMPVYAGNGAGSGECEFILRMRNGNDVFYVSYDNFDYSDENDFLVFKCRGIMDDFDAAKRLDKAVLPDPERASTLIKSVTLEGGALDGVTKNVELDWYFEFGEYFISKSERAENSTDEEFQWEIVQIFGSSVLLCNNAFLHSWRKKKTFKRN